MKNTSFFLLLLLSLLSFGCKKDGDGELSCGEKLEGTWRATSILFDGEENFGPTKAYQLLEIELWNFNAVDAEGKARTRFEIPGNTSFPSATGFYKPTNSCSRVTLPDWWWCNTGDITTTYTFDIVELDDEQLSLRTNYSRGSGCDGDLRVDFIKVQ